MAIQSLFQPKFNLISKRALYKLRLGPKVAHVVPNVDPFDNASHLRFQGFHTDSVALPSFDHTIREYRVLLQRFALHQRMGSLLGRPAEVPKDGVVGADFSKRIVNALSWSFDASQKFDIFAPHVGIRTNHFLQPVDGMWIGQWEQKC